MRNRLGYTLAAIMMMVSHFSFCRVYDLRLDGTTPGGEAAGWALATGDMDGDGLTDLAVGSPIFPGNYSGLVRVIRGSEWRLAAGATLSSEVASNIVGTTGLQSGWAVSYGDLNGDGYSDLAIGQPYASCDDPNWACGSVQVVYGSKSLPSEVLLTDQPKGRVVRYLGAQGDRVGMSLGTRCDMNADGIEDLILGAPQASLRQVAAGSVYVIYGRADTVFGNTIPLDNLTPDVGFRIDGSNAYQGAGSAVACLHSSNGIDVLAIGSRMQFGAFVHSAVWLLHDLQAPMEGVIDLVPSSNVLEIDEAGDYFTIFGANFAVADLNGDGCDDLAIAAPWDGDASNGKVYVLYGCTSIYTAQVMTKDQIAGTVGFHITGQDGDWLGDSSLAGADLDGDGLGDLVVGSIYSSDTKGLCKPSFGDGVAYILHGSKSEPDDVPASTLDCIIPKSTAAGGGWSTFALAAGDFDGNGLDDIASGAIYGGSDSEGAVYFCYSGVDDLPSASRAYFCNPFAGTNQPFIFSDTFE